MKTIKYKIFVLLTGLAGILLISCENWLDVRPKSEIKEKDMFSTEHGFRQALFGIYAGMSSSELYGGNLSMCFLDALAQNYSIASSQKAFYQETQYNYEDAGVEGRINSIWASMYNKITNCNNLLENLAGQESLFADDNYNFFLAETKALRAYLHFDLLRMFGASISSGGGDQLAIPFIDKVQNTPFPQLTANAMLNILLSELKEAKALLKDVDPIGPNFEDYVDAEDLYLAPGQANLYIHDDAFLLFRKSRMNYYAVCGLLARVYLYQGDERNALAEATEVLESGKFSWIDVDEDIVGQVAPDKIFYHELIFNLYDDQIDTKSEKYFQFKASDELWISDARKQEYFPYEDGGDSDYRFRYHFSKRGGNTEHICKYDYKGAGTEYIPMIRLSEMAYIAAECEPDPAKALEYLNLVLRNRGYTEQQLLNDASLLDTWLFKEYRREFLAEGQMFYYMKRKNIQEIEFSNQTGSNKIYVLPFPDVEKELGNIK